jgi:2-keto-4-pentenoate hydratase/2-oxohepta-3-ene-1,7-dioic acid hydratase in catechol pathway
MRYTRAKGFDTFCPVGPVVVTADSFNPSESRIELRVNGEPRQSSSLDDFIFDIPTVVSFISHVMTLYPGDLILTGTPSGVGPMRSGDHVEIEIGGIGVLSHAVV